MPIFPNHDTNSDNANYTETLYIYHNVKLRGLVSGINYTKTYLYHNVKFSNPISGVQIANFKQFQVPVLVLTKLRIAHRINSN